MSQKKKQYILRSWKSETVKIPVQLQVNGEDSVTVESETIQTRHQVSVYSSDESVSSDRLLYCSDNESVDSFDVNASTRGYDRLHSEVCPDNSSSNTALELINKEILT